MPAAIVLGTAQSACIGMQDVRSPLYVLLAAAVVNFLGDAALVPLGGPFGGAAGAALATVAGQYAALVFFGWWWLTVPGVAIGDDGDGDDDDHDDDDHGDDAPVPAAGWGANL